MHIKKEEKNKQMQILTMSCSRKYLNTQIIIMIKFMYHFSHLKIITIPILCKTKKVFHVAICSYLNNENEYPDLILKKKNYVDMPENIH